MNHERLLELANVVLPKVPAAKFSLDSWCGTTSCAAGWAAQHPPFTEQGLKLTLKNSSAAGFTFLCPAYRTLLGWKALDCFFDLKAYAVRFLFDEAFYPRAGRTNAAEVAQRIRNFVAGTLTYEDCDFLQRAKDEH